MDGVLGDEPRALAERHLLFAERHRLVVAGHLCLDLIPGAAGGEDAPSPRTALIPGVLGAIGPLSMAVGGCVGNTGLALHRLGLRPTLVARIGDDPLGGVLAGLVDAAVPAPAARLIVTPGGATSYSLVFNRRGEDRSIAHFPGVNDSFVAADVAVDLLQPGGVLHVGYPPLMAALVADEGRELVTLLEAARAAGVATSLDMANVGPVGEAGRAGWRRLLEHALRAVDVFLPSLDEAAELLGIAVARDADGAPDPASVGRLADELLGLGVAIAGLKLGERGLLVRTASRERLEAVPLPLAAEWAERELRSTVFETRLVGTAGAGDATIAGFLFGLASGMSPEDAVTAACATGGASTEAADGTSAVPAWSALEERLHAGWQRRRGGAAPGWVAGAAAGLWYGPRDRGNIHR